MISDHIQFKKKVLWTEEIPQIEDYDSIACSGGVPDIAADLSARCQGVRVLLLDRQCCLGGLATV